MRKVRNTDRRTLNHLRCLNRTLKRMHAMGCYFQFENLIVVDAVAVFNRALELRKRDAKILALPLEFYVQHVFAFAAFHELGHAFQDMQLKQQPTEKFAKDFQRWTFKRFGLAK